MAGQIELIGGETVGVYMDFVNSGKLAVGETITSVISFTAVGPAGSPALTFTNLAGSGTRATATAAVTAPMDGMIYHVTVQVGTSSGNQPILCGDLLVRSC